MKKIFYIVLALIISIGYVGVVNAEETWPADYQQYNSTIDSLVGGADLTNDTTAKEFLSKNEVYYKYVKIDNDNYNQFIDAYKNGTAENSEEEAAIAALVPAVNSLDEITSDEGGWTQVTATKIQLAMSGLNYNAESPEGYVVAIAAVDKNDNSKIYVYRGVYEVSSGSTLVNIKDVYTVGANDEFDEQEDGQADAQEPTATETNPETGLSDWAIYLVPLALISGSVLMFKRRYV